MTILSSHDTTLNAKQALKPEMCAYIYIYMICSLRPMVLSTSLDNSHRASIKMITSV